MKEKKVKPKVCRIWGKWTYLEAKEQVVKALGREYVRLIQADNARHQTDLNSPKRKAFDVRCKKLTGLLSRLVNGLEKLDRESK